MKFLILGGSGNLSSITVRQLLTCSHTVHCITRGTNPSLETELRLIGATFIHVNDLSRLSTDFSDKMYGGYDFVIDFIAYTSNDISSHLHCLFGRIRYCYVYISTTAFYERSFTQDRPYREDSINISDSWDYAINKYRAELRLCKLSNDTPFKTLVIRLGHTIGLSVPVYLGNPGRAFLSYITDGMPIPFLGDIDHPWSIGSGYGLSTIISSLPNAIAELPQYYLFHYSQIQSTWREIYSCLCSALQISTPLYKCLAAEDVSLVSPHWLPSIVNHKIYYDCYDLTFMSKYFSPITEESTKNIVSKACDFTLSQGVDQAYHSDRQKLLRLSCLNGYTFSL
ncbi:hypothetical protein [Cyanobium sp. WAJ14-Wanaka]|uniref:hypothetical protein n=1 Tax=Cyanobium sp. WAJ14-Wanaka TaxID=2823725 RepID=UPI0020CE3783|nr:hypothetical protein [Cyanobium sp. WAJ14-Wanaka]MCP9775680.1 hypothetical protein [Cyanobium sp. WAJ14-Wanaka]